MHALAKWTGLFFSMSLVFLAERRFTWRAYWILVHPEPQKRIWISRSQQSWRVQWEKGKMAEYKIKRVRHHSMVRLYSRATLISVLSSNLTLEEENKKRRNSRDEKNLIGGRISLDFLKVCVIRLAASRSLLLPRDRRHGRQRVHNANSFYSLIIIWLLPKDQKIYMKIVLSDTYMDKRNETKWQQSVANGWCFKGCGITFLHLCIRF